MVLLITWCSSCVYDFARFYQSVWLYWTNLFDQKGGTVIFLRTLSGQCFISWNVTRLVARMICSRARVQYWKNSETRMHPFVWRVCRLPLMLTNQCPLLFSVLLFLLDYWDDAVSFVMCAAGLSAIPFHFQHWLAQVACIHISIRCGMSIRQFKLKCIQPDCMTAINLNFH